MTTDDQPLAEIRTECQRIVAVADAQRVVVRLLGGAAVLMQSPPKGPLLKRQINDIDVVTTRGSGKQLTTLLVGAGYVPDAMFNALHGTERLLFYDAINDRKLDVFLGKFAMCHHLPIADRLEHHPLTVPLAELLMTKLQIVEINDRDVSDIFNLVYHHQISDQDDDAIEGQFIGRLCGRDWGLWRTATRTIDHCITAVPDYGLDDDAAKRIVERLDQLRKLIDTAPKTARWRLRSRIGERFRWYEEPEETAAGVDTGSTVRS